MVRNITEGVRKSEGISVRDKSVQALGRLYVCNLILDLFLVIRFICIVNFYFACVDAAAQLTSLCPGAATVNAKGFSAIQMRFGLGFFFHKMTYLLQKDILHTSQHLY